MDVNIRVGSDIFFAFLLFIFFFCKCCLKSVNSAVPPRPKTTVPQQPLVEAHHQPLLVRPTSSSGGDEWEEASPRTSRTHNVTQRRSIDAPHGPSELAQPLSLLGWGEVGDGPRLLCSDRPERKRAEVEWRGIVNDREKWGMGVRWSGRCEPVWIRCRSRDESPKRTLSAVTCQGSRASRLVSGIRRQ